MLVGLAYDLRNDYLARGYSLEETAEFDRPDTIEALEDALQALGHRTERIGHIWALVEALAAGRRWDLVFNIAEGLYGYSREAQVPALLEAYEIPCTFSDPLVMALTLHKGLTKQLLASHHLPTPAFALAETEADLARIDLGWPLFAKPVAEGTGKGITAASVIRNADQLLEVGLDLLARFRQPVLVETFLPGREFTVGIVGNGPEAWVPAVIEIVLLETADREVYSYDNKEECESRVEYRLVDDPEARQAADLALAAWRALGGRDAGRIDLRSDAAGRPSLLEINPLPGMHPEHSDLPILWALSGRPYLELIRAIVDSAGRRVPLKSTVR